MRTTYSTERRKLPFVVLVCVIAVALVAIGVNQFLNFYFPKADEIGEVEVNADYSFLQAGDFDKDALKKTFHFQFQGHDQAMTYRVYVPDKFMTHKYPVFMYLHGSEENGNDGSKPINKTVFFKNMTGTWFNAYPAILLMPQFPLDEKFAKDPEVMNAYVNLVNQVIADYNGNPKKVYATGLSQGADSVYGLLETHPDLFAAGVIVCGGKADNSKTANYKSVPVWIFHGEKDFDYKVDLARATVDAIKAAGGDVHYTEYPGVAHGIWDKAYSDSEMMKWLFQQQKK